MSFSAANGGMHHSRRKDGVEYSLYFALIVVLAVVPHVIGWLFQTVRYGRLPRLGPVGRAIKDATAVTPMIFRG